MYMQMNLPVDIDTSAQLRVTLYYTVRTGGVTGGIINWRLQWASAQIGSVVTDTSSIALANLNPNERVSLMPRSAVAPNTLGAHIFYLDVPDYIPPSDINAGAMLWLTLTRLGDTAEDTAQEDVYAQGIIVECVSRMDGIGFY